MSIIHRKIGNADVWLDPAAGVWIFGHGAAFPVFADSREAPPNRALFWRNDFSAWYDYNSSAGWQLAGSGGPAGGVAISAGTNLATAGTVSFGDSNGVTFGLDVAGVLTGSVETNYQPPGAYLTTAQPPGAYLTTAALSQDSSKYAGTVGAITGGSITVNTAGVSVNLPAYLTTAQPPGAYLTTAMASNRGSDFVQATAAFAGTNASGTVASNGISVSVGNYLTTAMASNRGSDFVQATAAFAGTSASGTIASNGISVSVGPYITTAALSNHSHGVTAGNGGFNFQTLSFSNANGISFGTSAGSAITGSHNALTTAMASNRGSDFVQATAAFAGTSASGTIASNGISVSVGPYITTGALSNHSHGASASNGSFAFQTLNFSNANNVTFGTSAGGIVTASVAAGGGDAIRGIAAGGSTATTNTVNFSNSNGVSFGFGAAGNSTVITASHNALTTARASNDAVGLNTALTAGPLAWTVNSGGLSLNAGSAAGTTSGFAGANISGSMTHNTAGLALSLSVAAPGAAAENNWFTLAGNVVGNSSASGSTIQLSAGNNVTLSGTNGSVIRIDAGGAYTALTYANRQLGASTTINQPQNSLWLAPFRLVAPVSASTIIHMMSLSGTITSAATAQYGLTLRMAIWSNVASATSQFSTLWSDAISATFWNSGTSSYSYNISGSGGTTSSLSAASNLGVTSIMGPRILSMFPNSIFPAGLYIFGHVQSTSSAGYSAAMSRIAPFFDNPLSAGMASFHASTNASVGYADGGTFSVTTGAIPNTIALSEIRQINNVMPFFKMGAL